MHPHRFLHKFILLINHIINQDLETPDDLTRVHIPNGIAMPSSNDNDMSGYDERFMFPSKSIPCFQCLLHQATWMAMISPPCQEGIFVQILMPSPMDGGFHLPYPSVPAHTSMCHFLYLPQSPQTKHRQILPPSSLSYSLPFLFSLFTCPFFHILGSPSV